MKDISHKVMALIGLVLLCYYVMISLNPVQWGDSGYYLYRIVKGPFILEILHPMGHPLFQFASKFSFLVFGVNGILVFNTFCLFFSLFVLWGIANRISKNGPPDYRFFLGFMVLHSVVWTSTHIEVYQFHLLLVLLGLLFLFDPSENSFWIAGLFWGLSLCVHQMTILVIPILLFWVFKYFNTSKVIRFGLGLMIGSLFLLPAFIKNWDLGLFNECRFLLTGASASNSGWEDNLFSIKAFSISSFIFNVISFGSILNPCTFVFFKKSEKGSKEMKLLYVLGIIFLFFALTYQVSDRFTFLLPFLALSALKASLQSTGSTIFSSKFLLFCYLLPVVLFGLFAWYQPELNAQKYELNNLAIRDESRYYGFPWIKNSSAFDFGDSYVKSLKEEHPIYTDYDIKGCLNTYLLKNQMENTFQVVSSKNEVYSTKDSIFYLPRLTLIDTSIFAKISPVSSGFLGKLKSTH